MGARFRLKASYDISGFSPQAQVVLRAMQQYGLILADNGSNWYFGGTADPAWPSALVNELKEVPASAFEAVDESSLMVDPNSGQARQNGGAGARARPPRATAWPRPTAASSPSASRSTGAWAGTPWTANIVGMAATPDGGGYWLVAADGGIFTFGDAGFYGSTGGHPPEPAHRGHGRHARRQAATGWWPPTGASSASATPAFYGSTGALHLNQPIVGMAATPDGGGYWLVAADGGIFSFGDAALLRLHRRPSTSTSPSWAWRPRPAAAATGWWPRTAASSPSATPPSTAPPATSPSTQPIVGMAATPDGGGYWLVAADGGVFTYGDARFEGSDRAHCLVAPIVGSGRLSRRALGGRRAQPLDRSVRR